MRRILEIIWFVGSVCFCGLLGAPGDPNCHGFLCESWSYLPIRGSYGGYIGFSFRGYWALH